MTERHTGGVNRPYRMRKRREDIEDTRRRIVEAAVDLHGTVGPAHTTFSAVAERAGVQRSTVYRHFADEAALFGACTSHWLADHPWPRPEDWTGIADPAERLLHALRDLYRYFERNEQMLANSYRDIDSMPPFVGELMRAQLRAFHDVLMAPWPDTLSTRDRLASAIAHALDFRAWQSLAGVGLTWDEAASLMAEMVTAVATPCD